MKAIYISLVGLFIGGCATDATQPERPLSYEDVVYAHPSGDIRNFSRDLNDCRREAQQQYENSVENIERLAAIYGPVLTPELLQGVRRRSVVDCMAGDSGKGWVVVKRS